MSGDDGGEPVALLDDAGEVLGELLEVELLLVAQLEDLAVYLRVREQGVQVQEERVDGAVRLTSGSVISFFLRVSHTLWRMREENSKSVFEKWFRGSVIPDSRKPRPCTAIARSL